MENHQEVVRGLGTPELHRRQALAANRIEVWRDRYDADKNTENDENYQREIEWWENHLKAVKLELQRRGEKF